jgi:hypothetical protein
LALAVAVYLIESRIDFTHFASYILVAILQRPLLLNRARGSEVVAERG